MKSPIKSPAAKIAVAVGGIFLIRHIIGRNIERGFRQTHETSIDVAMGDYRIQVLKPLPGEKGSYEWIVEVRWMNLGGVSSAYGSASTEEEAYAAAVNWIETNG